MQSSTAGLLEYLSVPRALQPHVGVYFWLHYHTSNQDARVKVSTLSYWMVTSNVKVTSCLMKPDVNITTFYVLFPQSTPEVKFTHHPTPGAKLSVVLEIMQNKKKQKNKKYRVNNWGSPQVKVLAGDLDSLGDS